MGKDFADDDDELNTGQDMTEITYNGSEDDPDETKTSEQTAGDEAAEPEEDVTADDSAAEPEQTAGDETAEPEEDVTADGGAAEPEQTEDDETAEPEQASEPESERKKKKMSRGKKIALIVIIAVAAALAAAYLITGFWFTKHYLPETTINGVDASLKTVEEVQQEIADRVNDYDITIKERGGGEEIVLGTDIGLVIEFDDTLDNLLDEQKSFLWIAELKNAREFEPDRLLSYDEDMLETTLSGLACMDEGSMTISEDAKITYSEDSEQFEVIDAVFGTYMEAETLEAAVGAAVLELSETLDLEEAGCYTDPVYTEESDEIIAAHAEMNELLATDIAYDMEDAGTVEISKDEMSLWITTDENMEVVIDEDAVAEFVSDFADQYDTLYHTHTLATTYGSTVTITSGSYGWKINQETETAQLIEDLEAKEDVTREPNYSSRAASHSGNDYGNTYVEINLTAQHLYFYKNGSLVVESDIVSGCVADGNSTPTGIYGITYKEKDATLNGEDYSTPVSYWMPFNGGVGLHDATWRSSFGGTIYKTNGSHGCINLPYSVAQTIFENISTNDPVIVYTLAGTEQSSKSSSSSSSDDDDDEEEEDEDEDDDASDEDEG